MAARTRPADAPGLAHPTVVPTNAESDEECPKCGASRDEA